MHYCIIYAQNEMSYREILKECKNEKWVPILVTRVDEKTFVPLFTSLQTAIQFIKRNLPKGSLVGTMDITEDDARFIDEKGWEPVVYEWPKKVKDIAKFDIEVMEHQDDREFPRPRKMK